MLADDKIETTGLHLGLYLAQWGMFRGSGNLINQNLNYFMWMSNFFFEDLPNKFSNFYQRTFDDFKDENFCKEFDEVVLFIRAEKLMMNPSDTLVSKILIGIWGHVPAFDSQFKATARELFKDEKKLPITCDSKSLKILEKHARENELDRKLGKMSFEMKGKTYDYTLAKKVDMALWIGVD